MTATYDKPTKIARWADTSTNIVEPPEGKKDEGWLFEEIPPSSYENWRTNLIGDWLKWFDERLFDGTTKDDFLIKCPADASDALLITTGYVKSEKEFRVEGDAHIADGLVVGFTGTAIDDVILIGDDKFALEYKAGDPQILFDTGDSLQYLRSDKLVFEINASEVFSYTNSLALFNLIGDFQLDGGINVGYSGTPLVNRVHIRDVDFRLDFSTSDNPKLYFDSTTYLHYDRNLDNFFLFVEGSQVFKASDSADELEITKDTIIATGLNVGYGGTVADNTLKVGDDKFYLNYTTNVCTMLFEPGSLMAYNRSTDDFSVTVNSTVAIRYYDTPKAVTLREWAEVEKGLAVGFTGTYPLIDNAVHVGDYQFRLDYNSGNPRILFDGPTNWDYFQYDRGGNDYGFYVNSTPMFAFDYTSLKHSMVGGLDIASDLKVTTNAEVLGGLIVGFDGTPVADAIQVLDDEFGLYGDVNQPYLKFDDGATTSYDGLVFNRSNDTFGFMVNGAAIFTCNPTTANIYEDVVMWEDLEVYGGLNVGFSGTVVDDAIQIGGANFGLFEYGSYRQLEFDATLGDGIRYSGRDISIESSSLSKLFYDQSEDTFYINSKVKFVANLDSDIIPTMDGTDDPKLDLGNADYFFEFVYAHTYYGVTSTIQTGWDKYDDLALIEACELDSSIEPSFKEKDGVLREVHALRTSTIPWPMMGPKRCIDFMDATMFLLGAIKQLHAKHKEATVSFENRLAALEARL